MEYYIFESSLSPIEALKSVFSNPTFRGRARRSEFWWYALFATALGAFIVLFLLSNESSMLKIAGSVISTILAYFYLSVYVRRFHDVGWSGWWIACHVVINALLFFLRNFEYYSILQIIASVYTTAILLICALDGDKNKNKYGISPKYAVMGQERESLYEEKRANRETFLNNMFIFLGFCRIGIKIAGAIVLARWLCDIDSLEIYEWYHGIWHGLFIVPNWIYSFFNHDVLCKAQFYTTGYNVCWWIMLVWQILVLLSSLSGKNID